jgi:predicted permease
MMVSIVLTVLSPLIGRHTSTNAMLRIMKEAGSPEGVNAAHLNQAISTAQSAWVASLVLSSIASVALVVCLIAFIKEQRKSNQQ